MDTTMKYT